MHHQHRDVDALVIAEVVWKGRSIMVTPAPHPSCTCRHSSGRSLPVRPGRRSAAARTGGRNVLSGNCARWPAGCATRLTSSSRPPRCLGARISGGTALCDRRLQHRVKSDGRRRRPGPFSPPVETWMPAPEALDHTIPRHVMAWSMSWPSEPHSTTIASDHYAKASAEGKELNIYASQSSGNSIVRDGSDHLEDRGPWS